MGRQVSEASAAWLVHWVLLKGALWALGIPGAVPFLELAAYAGYAFVPVCISMVAGLALGAAPDAQEARRVPLLCSRRRPQQRAVQDSHKHMVAFAPLHAPSSQPQSAGPLRCHTQQSQFCPQACPFCRHSQTPTIPCE